MAEDTLFRTQNNAAAPAEESGKRPCLIMIRGDFIGQVFELSREVTMIGRSDDVDLVVSDASISRRHAMVVRKNGAFQVSDLGSTNGTYLNKVPVKDPIGMKEGDKLVVGAVTFKFTYQDEDDTAYHMMLRNMAIKDGLTRIYNKRYMAEALDKEFEYNRRTHAGLALILFDIDYFKRVNDSLGHPAGDHVLKCLAQEIEHEARGYDLFARYGGEEFVFMLRGTELEDAVALAERVRSVVEELEFEYDDEKLKITISLGVAFWSGDDSIRTPAELVRRADEQLYRAKGAGRNRVAYDGDTDQD